MATSIFLAHISQCNASKREERNFCARAPSSQVRAPHTAETCPSSECGGSDTERSASLTIQPKQGS